MGHVAHSLGRGIYRGAVVSPIPSKEQPVAAFLVPYHGDLVAPDAEAGPSRVLGTGGRREGERAGAPEGVYWRKCRVVEAQPDGVVGSPVQQQRVVRVAGERGRGMIPHVRL